MRSGLNKSKQLVEQFQEAVEKAKNRGKEELSKKYDEVKMAIEKDTETKVVELMLDKLNYSIGEYDKKFKKMLPNYKVSCYSQLM